MYEDFSEVYDLLMGDIPYEAWCVKITGLLRSYGVDSGLVLELGCGTGTMTELMADAGYDMIGVDASEQMLQKALEKRDASGHDILYLLQDMRDFELYGTVGAVISVCDSMNYMLTTEDLTTVFRLVNNYLDPGGIFIFDMKTPYCYENVLADRTVAEAFQDAAYIWDNYYDEETRLNEYEVTVFTEDEDGRYTRFSELHRQHAFTLEEVLTAAREAGMEPVAIAKADNESGESEVSEEESGAITEVSFADPASPDAAALFASSERVYFILKEKGKEKNE